MSLPNNEWVWKEVSQYVTSDQKHLDAVCVLGPTGIGKTFKIREIAECGQWDVYSIHSANCQNAKDLRDMIQKGMRTSLISNLAQIKAQKVVIIDELEVLLQVDRTMASALSDCLQEHRTSKGRIILIGNSSIEKKVGGLKAQVRVMECCMPSEADMFLWCKQHAPKGMRKTVMMEIAEAVQGNPNLALQLLASKSKPKFELAKPVELSARDVLRMKMLDDPWLYPLRFHENLIKEVGKKKGSKLEKQRVYQQLLQMLCEWDMMMSSSTDYAVAIEHILSALTTVINQLENKKVAGKEAMEDFTKVFSNLSLQKKQERSLYARTTDFPWMHAQIMCDYKHYR